MVSLSDMFNIYYFQHLIWMHFYLAIMKVSKGVLKKATVEQGFCFDKHGLRICLVLLQNLLQKFIYDSHMNILNILHDLQIVSPTQQNFLPSASFLAGCESVHTEP